MDRAAISSFLSRDFAGAERLKRAHWAALYRAEGPSATLAGSDALRAHMRTIRPDWPSAAEMADDLAHHVAERRLFERIAHGLARR
jgi:hypothetical protein